MTHQSSGQMAGTLSGTFMHISTNRLTHAAIQFTMEEESGENLPFLDTLVQRKGTMATTAVYQKPTHTDNFKSHHHPRVLRGII